MCHSGFNLGIHESLPEIKKELTIAMEMVKPEDIDDKDSCNATNHVYTSKFADDFEEIAGKLFLYFDPPSPLSP